MTLLGIGDERIERDGQDLEAQQKRGKVLCARQNHGTECGGSEQDIELRYIPSANVEIQIAVHRRDYGKYQKQCVEKRCMTIQHQQGVHLHAAPAPTVDARQCNYESGNEQYSHAGVRPPERCDEHQCQYDAGDDQIRHESL